MVIVCKPKRPPTLIRLVSGPLTRPLTIKVDRDPGTSVPGVRVFTPTAGPFDRNSAASHVLDFRWAINLGERHANVDFNDGANPIATLTEGILYTSNLSPEELGPRLVQGEIPTALHRFSADLAAAIRPPHGKSVVVSWDELGEPRTFSVPRRLDPLGTKYTIALLNDPPTSNAEDHDELSLYYKVLQVDGSLIQDDQCTLEFTGEPSTDEIPCMPIVLNSGGG